MSCGRFVSDRSLQIHNEIVLFPHWFVVFAGVVSTAAYLKRVRDTVQCPNDGGNARNGSGQVGEGDALHLVS